MDDNFVSVSEHYDMLVDEGNDPVYDPEPLKKYMDKSDGQFFINCLDLTPFKDVLEVGVGTGRLAIRVAGKCNTFCGVDISEKTAAKARENLKEYGNVSIVSGDFLEYKYEASFDVIYTSQVLWHISDKQKTIHKIAGLLKADGLFVLSIDKAQPELLDYDSRKIKMYPDNKDKILKYIEDANLIMKHIEELENAYVIVSYKR